MKFKDNKMIFVKVRYKLQKYIIKLEQRKIANHVLKMLRFIHILKGCKYDKMYGKTEEEFNMMT